MIGGIVDNIKDIIRSSKMIFDDAAKLKEKAGNSTPKEDSFFNIKNYLFCNAVRSSLRLNGFFKKPAASPGIFSTLENPEMSITLH
jgi:hypothetical protein